jgi:hypothetical protein
MAEESVTANTHVHFAGDLTTCKNTSGLLCTANWAPIILLYELQIVAAQSTVAAEFVAASKED